MKGQVIPLHDGCRPRLESSGWRALPWVLVEFEKGVVAAVDPEIEFEKPHHTAFELKMIRDRLASEAFIHRCVREKIVPVPDLRIY